MAPTGQHHANPVRFRANYSGRHPAATLLCTRPLSVTISSPTSSAVSGVSNTLSGFANSPNAGSVNCDNFQWSVNAPDTLNPASGQGCTVLATFNSPGSRTLKLNVVDNFLDQFGRTISEAGSASESINVTNLPPGSYIIGTNPRDRNSLVPPFNFPFIQTLNFQQDSFPAFIQLTGEFISPACVPLCFVGETTNSWTATDSSGHTTSIGTGLTVNWTVPAIGFYTITMTTTGGFGNVIGTATMIANIISSIR